MFAQLASFGVGGRKHILDGARARTRWYWGHNPFRKQDDRGAEAAPLQPPGIARPPLSCSAATQHLAPIDCIPTERQGRRFYRAVATANGTEMISVVAGAGFEPATFGL